MRKCKEHHPLTNFIYYLCLIGFLCFQSNPALTAAGFIGLLITNYLLEEHFERKDISFYALMFVLIALVNPIFNHNGSTVLFLVNRKAVTLEACLYGIHMSGVIITTLLWCRQMSHVFHEEQMMYILGRFFGKLALILSMTMKFIPLYRKQAQEFKLVRQGMGISRGETFLEKCKADITIFSATVTWALEHSMETSDSIRARGYGVKKRSFYTNYLFQKKDAFICFTEIILLIILILGKIKGLGHFYFYPTIGYQQMNPEFGAQIGIFLVFAVFPALLTRKRKNIIMI